MTWTAPGKKALQAGDRLIACPTCKSTRPKAGLHKLWQTVIRAGKPVSWEEGGTLACEECGTVFCYDTEGTYVPAAAKRAQPESKPEERPVEVTTLPIPRQRTRV